MRFDQLNIERFGELGDLSFDSLSPSVNVMYSRDAAERASFARFVRWMIYGDLGERVDAAGTMAISDGTRCGTFGRCTVPTESVAAASINGHVTLDSTGALTGWIDNVPSHVFSTLCLPGADRVMRIQDLLSACRSYGIHLVSRAAPEPHSRERQLRRENLQRQLHQLPWRGRDVQGLLDRQRVLQQSLQSVESSLRQRRSEAETERRSVVTQMGELEARLERTRTELRQLDIEIAERRRILDEAWQESRETLRQRMAARRQELASLESSIQRARDMLAELYQRREVIIDLKSELSERTRQSRQEEIAQLDSSQSSLQTWLDGLRAQRDQLLDELNQRGSTDLAASSLSWWYASVHPEHPPVPSATRIPWTGLDPQKDPPLRTMLDRRQHLDTVVTQLARQMTELENRQRDLDDPRWHVRAEEAEGLRREIAEVETLLRVAEDRARLEREIAQLSLELDRPSDDRHAHAVIRDASALLGRISGMELRAVRLLDPQRVEVDSPRNGWLTLDQLASHQRAIVYLSLLLAVNSALRRTHWKLPLFLETSYLDLPRESFGRVAEEFERLARTGVQLFVLTSDYDFGRLLASRGAHWHDLMPRAEAMPPTESTDPKPSFDSIRFRPQVDPTSTIERQIDAPSKKTPRRARKSEHVARPVAVRARTRRMPSDEITAAANPMPKKPQPSVDRRIVAPKSISTTKSSSQRFLLDTSDGIMLAPAIGPTTARRLQRFGVLTIDHLLAAEPASLAGELKNSKISPDRVARWQSQANLMCRVPNLREQDARILVACGIRQVDQLQSAAVEELWQQVKPFLATRKCREIIGTGQLPDIDCVAQWIQCAQHARALHAA